MNIKALVTNPVNAARLARHSAILALVAILAACGSVPKAPIVTPSAPAPVSPPAASPRPSAPLPALPAAGSGHGGYYQDDGPGEHPPEGLMETPDPMPQVEPLSASGNKPYTVFGKTYTPITDGREFKQRGIGSWYGKKFHGQKTSSGELYDMYKLSAAHPTLPIPSYARVTNLSTGTQVIVRVNDRGPFHSNRIIDLSYTAALKLGILGKGSSELEVERLLPEEIARIAAARQGGAISGTDTPSDIPSPSLASLDHPAGDTQAVPIDPPAHPMVLEPISTAHSSDDGATLASGFYLQFGAFSEATNAEAARGRLMASWDSSLPPPAIVSIGAFYRLHSGPYASRAEALAAAQKAQAFTAIKPLIVQH